MNSNLLDQNISFEDYQAQREALYAQSNQILGIIPSFRNGEVGSFSISMNKDSGIYAEPVEVNRILKDYPAFDVEGLDSVPDELKLCHATLKCFIMTLETNYRYFHLVEPVNEIYIEAINNKRLTEFLDNKNPSLFPPTRKVFLSIINELDDEDKMEIAHRIALINPMADFEDILDIFEEQDAAELKKVLTEDCDKEQREKLSTLFSNVYKYGEVQKIVDPYETMRMSSVFRPNNISNEIKDLMPKVEDLESAQDLIFNPDNEEFRLYGLVSSVNGLEELHRKIMFRVFEFLEKKNVKYKKHKTRILEKLESYPEQDYIKSLRSEFEMQAKAKEKKEQAIVLNPEHFILPDSFFDLAYEEMKDTYIPQLNYGITKQGPAKLQEMVEYIASQGFIENSVEVKNLFVFRMTGHNRPQGDLPVIKWNNPNNNHGYELIYLIANAFESKSKFKDMKRFFEGPEWLEGKPSALANSAKTQFRRQLHKFYPEVFKLKSNEIE